MSVLASAAMTTPVDAYEGSLASAVTGRELLEGDVIVQTQWEIAPVQRILELQHLDPNWDDYGSPPPSKVTATRAIAFIGQIAGLGFDDLPSPGVAPVAGGGIALEWTRPHRQLHLSVFPDGTSEYVEESLGEVFVEGSVNPWMIGRLRALISALMYNTVA